MEASKSAFGLGLEPLENYGENKAIPLIKLKKNHFVINEEALDFLRSIDMTVGVIGVCGKYRTGKSYLLNRLLLNTQKAFDIGSTINACTKGIWIYKQPLKFTYQDQEMALIILDTEGLSAIDEDETHDTKVVLLSLLLSSLLLYNSMGSINENALESLSLVINISKNLQINNQNVDSDEFVRNFPTFLWILRDFSLKLIDLEGNKINSKQYLENALASQKGSSEIIENKNRTRRLFKHFFSERDCCTLVRPTENEKDLQNLINLSEKQVRDEFISQIGMLLGKIKKKLKPKIVDGKRVNGSMLADLVVSYTKCVNSGKVPSIESAWSYVCKNECTKAVEEIEEKFTTLIQQKMIPKFPISKSEMKELRESIQNECMAEFKNRIVGDQDQIYEYEEAITSRFKKIHTSIKKQNYEMSMKVCENYFKNIYKPLAEKLNANEYKSFILFEEDLLKIFHDIPVNIKENIGYSEIKANFSLSKILEGSEKICDYICSKNVSEYRLVKERLKNTEKELLDRKTSILKEREIYAQKLQESEGERLNLKSKEGMLRTKLETLAEEKYKIESRYIEEKENLKARALENELHLKTDVKTYELEIKSLKEDLFKKNMEDEKSMALFEQKITFLEEKNTEQVKSLNNYQDDTMTYKERIRQYEHQISELKDEMRKKDNDRGVCNTSRKTNIDANVLIENNYLKQQLEFMEKQNKENKALYSTLMSAIDKGFTETRQKDNTLLETNKELSTTIRKVEERCSQLELHIYRLKKYDKMIKSSSYIECKGCSCKYPPSLFHPHTKICKALLHKHHQTRHNQNHSHNHSHTHTKSSNSLKNITNKHTRSLKLDEKMHDQNKENQEALLMDAEYELSESLSPVQREEFNIEVLYEQLAFNTSRSMSSTGGEAQEVYSVRVKNGSKEYIMYKEFEEFNRFHKDLMNQHAKLQFPSSASVFLNEKYNPDDQQYYQKKQIDIDSYLRELSQIYVVREGEIFQKFLEIEEQ